MIQDYLRLYDHAVYMMKSFLFSVSTLIGALYPWLTELCDPVSFFFLACTLSSSVSTVNLEPTSSVLVQGG